MSINIKFKDMRAYISKIDRISICDKETLSYENYRFISDVPDGKYDEMYLYGIGMIDSEFKLTDAPLEPSLHEDMISDTEYIAKCIEIMLSKYPKITA